MKRKQLWSSALLWGAIALSASTSAWSEEWEGNKYKNKDGSKYSASNTTHITNSTYQNECSACHFAYPAGFLPERSWIKIMGNLTHHFGENAELSQAKNSAITDYLRQNSSDQSPNYFGRRIAQSVGAHDVPLRISETPYFERKHDEIPARMIKGNQQVRSLANCAACHTGAEQGSFSEHGIVIPNFGRWED